MYRSRAELAVADDCRGLGRFSSVPRRRGGRFRRAIRPTSKLLDPVQFDNAAGDVVFVNQRSALHLCLPECSGSGDFFYDQSTSHRHSDRLGRSFHLHRQDLLEIRHHRHHRDFGLFCGRIAGMSLSSFII